MEAGVPIFVEHWGIIRNFTPILPYFQHWGDEPRPRVCSGEQIKWRPKKKVFTKNETLFSSNSGEDKKKVFTRNGTIFFPNSSGHLRSDAHQCQIMRGDAGVDHILKLLGGDTVKLLGGCFPPPPPPPGFGTPCWKTISSFKVFAL